MQQGLTVETLLKTLDEQPLRLSTEYKRIEKMPKMDPNERYEIKVISGICNDSCKGVEIQQLVKLLNSNQKVQCTCKNELLINDLNYEKQTGLRRKLHPSLLWFSVISHYVMTPILFKTDIKKIDSDQVARFLNTLIKNRNKGNYTSNLVEQKENQILEFDVICPMGNCKVIMPVRHKNCKHLQCYELTSLIFTLNDLILQNNSYKDQICYVPGCKSSFNMESENQLLSELVFDYELFNAINLGQSGIVTFILQNKQIKDSFSFYGKDEIISQLSTNRRNPKTTDAEFQDKVLKKCQFLLAHSNIDKPILSKIQQTRWATYELSMKDPISNKFIKYPGRCNKCQPEKHCSDIRTLVSIFFLQESDVKEFFCPLCQNKLFSADQKKQPEQLFYFDFQLFEIKNSEHENIILSEKYLLKHNGKKQLLYELLTKSRVRKEIFIQKENTFKGNSFHSGLDKEKRLIDPLVLMSCPEQRRIDFSELFEALEKKKFMIENEGITLCKCMFCYQNPIKSLKGQVFYDELMAEVLLKIKETQKDSPFIYNFKTNSISFQDQLMQTKLIPEFLQDNFYDMTQDLEYQNLFKTNENQITITDIKFNTPLANLQYTQEGIKVMVDQEKIDELNNVNKPTGIRITGFQIKNILGTNQQIIGRQF